MLARHSGAVVCAVRYSLAPERRFPHQHEEALAALRWVAAGGRAWHRPGPDRGGRRLRRVQSCPRSRLLQAALAVRRHLTA
ncbi:alpha/beta hydrolase fold domain-containing protein [Azospirillum himalayense]|uniref:Alpha/beta hydrolase fold domain-containing protein n=1 Tax=Azospirillum himalayense TaxID=654847 RepID=A0ABW0G160_9PROT